MKWTDINELAVELCEAHPEVDPLTINFVDLMNWVIALPGFEDDQRHCGEKILRGRPAALWREDPRGDPAGLDR